MQRDLFTGNLMPNKIRSARGEGHILLKAAPDEKYPVPGMAHFAGTGPQGKRCQHCAHLGDLPYWGRRRTSAALANQKEETAPKNVEVNACRKAAEMFEGFVQKGGIEFENACKYFEEPEQEGS
jgi:hypothetical protein